MESFYKISSLSSGEKEIHQVGLQSEDNVDFGDLSAAPTARSAPSPLGPWEEPPPASKLVLPQGVDA